jgi:hypothetical protein
MSKCEPLAAKNLTISDKCVRIIHDLCCIIVTWLQEHLLSLAQHIRGPLCWRLGLFSDSSRYPYIYVHPSMQYNLQGCWSTPPLLSLWPVMTLLGLRSSRLPLLYNNMSPTRWPPYRLLRRRPLSLTPVCASSPFSSKKNRLPLLP